MTLSTANAKMTKQDLQKWVETAKTDVPGANKALMAQIDGTNKVAAAGN